MVHRSGAEERTSRLVVEVPARDVRDDRAALVQVALEHKHALGDRREPDGRIAVAEIDDVLAGIGDIFCIK